MYLSSRRGCYEAIARVAARGPPLRPSASGTSLLPRRNTPPIGSSGTNINSTLYYSSRGAFSPSAAGYRGASLSASGTEAVCSTSGGSATAAAGEAGRGQTAVDPGLAAGRTTGTGSSRSGSGQSPPPPPRSDIKGILFTFAGGAALFGVGYFGVKLLQGKGKKKTTVPSDVRSLFMCWLMLLLYVLSRLD